MTLVGATHLEVRVLF